MPHPVTKPEVLTALESNAHSVVEYFMGLSDGRFFVGDPDHWGPGHHLAHLTQVSVSLGRALRGGTLPLHPTSRSRTYAEVRDAATTSLAATPKPRLLEMGRIVVIAPGASRADVIGAFEGASAELRAAAGTWSEEALDRHALQHPLIGQMTVREMLFFFVVHERHHLKLVRTREDASLGASDDSVAPGSRAFLEAEGFGGFFTVGQLHAEGCEGLPNEPGVYAIARESLDPPEFLTKSVGPVYRGQDPTRPVDELKQRWVTGAQILYFGRACGPGVRALLKQRVKRYLRFGHGRVVGHWGGRFVWQLRDHAGLRVAWKAASGEDPAQIEARLQARFRQHYGVLPFANLKHESGE